MSNSSVFMENIFSNKICIKTVTLVLSDLHFVRGVPKPVIQRFESVMELSTTADTTPPCRSIARENTLQIPMSISTNFIALGWAALVAS